MQTKIQSLLDKLRGPAPSLSYKYDHELTVEELKKRWSTNFINFNKEPVHAHHTLSKWKEANSDLPYWDWVLSELRRNHG